MTRQVDFDGKTYSFPDSYTDAEISVALQALDKATSNADYYLEGSLFLLAIFAGYLIFRKLSKERLLTLYSVLQRLFLVVLVIVALWMFRYEVTPTHPHQCLDRWVGQVVNC